MKREKQTRQKLLAVVGALVATLVTGAAQAVKVVPETEPYPPWTIAPYDLSNYDLNLEPGQAFQPTFDHLTHTGNLFGWTLDQYANRVPGWYTTSVYAALELADPDYWRNRKIIFLDDAGDQQPFWWDRLSLEQKKLIDDPNSDALGPEDSPVFNYLRGDRSNETVTGFRRRPTILGDMTNSSPVHVGAPKQAFDYYPLYISDYGSYRDLNADRDGRVYIGANDGMVHAFDAATGEEVWSYVPSMIAFDDLATLADPAYTHKYFVDGDLVAMDVKSGGSWRTLLAGGLGAGGKGLFILDVTSPDLGSIATDKKILAEIDGSDPNIGYIHGPVTMTLLEDDEWYLVTGNGFLPTNKNANLYLIPLANPASMSPIRISVPEGGTLGLAPPALIDADGNGKADTAYAGDLKGNMWKFNLTTRSSESAPLFDAGDKQPITTRPEVAAHPSGGFMVYFGTGSVLSSDDAGNTDTQSVYAIHDYIGRTQRVDKGELIQPGTLELNEVSAHGKTLRVGGPYTRINLQKGWKVDLPTNGERLLTTPTLRAGRLQFVTTFPVKVDDITRTYSWYMELDWLSGGSANRAISDFNQDGKLDDGDMVSFFGSPAYAVGEYLGGGVFSSVRLAHTITGYDVAFINGLIIDYPGGLTGGKHFDVDTDHIDDGLGGGTDQHTHEYDKKDPAGSDVDYHGAKLDSAGHEKLDTLTALHLGLDETFILTFANADLSPGAVVSLYLDGVVKEWNVLEYQKMIQEKLQTYDGTSDLKTHFRDARGTPLIYTRAGSSDPDIALERLVITFDPDAWAKGGIVGTNTGCVNGDPYETTPYRWRSGALNFHAITGESLKSANWLAGEKPWVAQNPPDLSTAAEGYGGVHANLANDSGFVYESAIFWHHDPGECYGQEGWGAASIEESGAVTEAMLYSMLYDKNDFTPEKIEIIMQAIMDISNLTCDPLKGFYCTTNPDYLDNKQVLDQYFNFEDIQNAAEQHEGILTLTEAYDPGQDESKDASNIITPKDAPVVEDINERQSWIDIEL